MAELSNDVPYSVLWGLFEEAARLVLKYSVSLIFGGRLIGSGTLVSVGSKYGILTAHHVVDLLLEKPAEHLGLNIYTREHFFYVPQPTVRMVTLGKSPEVRTWEDYTADGPDLAFIQFLDIRQIATVKSLKSFCPLDNNPLNRYPDLALQQTHWLVVGAPSLMCHPSNEPGVIAQGLRVGHFHGVGHLVDQANRGAFDFLTIRVPRDKDGYPAKYDGVSGGGAWLMPLSTGPAVGDLSIQVDGPIFAGVPYWETIEDVTSIILAHGPGSIYGPATLRPIAEAKD